jgi:Zn-dependent M28 family amino/carboxypeptidase
MIAQYRARRALRSKILEFLENEGIALLIRGSRGKHGTFFTSGGGDGYSKDATHVHASIDMAPEHADMMARLIENGIEVELDADIRTTFFDDNLNSFNVIGELSGTDKKLQSELVMLGGHLDSWHAGTGAVDNAAGCIVMMEAVRILKAIGIEPRRTIRIALWSAEEQGLYGSRNYVKNHFADREDMTFKQDYDKLSAYYNIDNGTGRIRGIYMQENDMLRPIFEAWFKPFEDMVDNPVVTIQSTSSTDHRAFDEVGLPGFQFIQDPIEYRTRTWHTNMDTYERLLIPDLKQMAVIVASFVYLTAQREEKLPRKPLPERQ